MRKYQEFVIVCSIIFGMFVAVYCYYSPGPQLHIQKPVTEEDFLYLREEVVKVAKTLDIHAISDKDLEDEELWADFYINLDELVITVESSRAKVTAKIPITQNYFEVQNIEFKMNGKIDFENIVFEETTKLVSITGSILMCLMAGFVFGMGWYLLFYEMVDKFRYCKWKA